MSALTGGMPQEESGWRALTIAANLDRAARLLSIANKLHCEEGHLPNETIKFLPLEAVLTTMAEAIREKDYKKAAKICHNFSVIEHGRWLAEQRVIRFSVKAPGKDHAQIRRASVENGRKRRSPRGWIPFELPGVTVDSNNTWQRVQAKMLLEQILRELDGGNASKLLRLIADHRLSVRIEKEIAKRLDASRFLKIKKRLPLRWQPLTPYSKSPKAEMSLRGRIIRKIRKLVKKDTPFYIQIDRGCGEKPRELGPFSNPRDILALPSIVRDAEMYVRPAGSKTLKVVRLPRFKTRPKLAIVDGEYEDLCKRLGRDDIKAVEYAWTAWRIKPSAEVLKKLSKGPERANPILAAIKSNRSGRGLRTKVVNLDDASIGDQHLIDQRPSSDFRKSAQY